MSPLWH